MTCPVHAPRPCKNRQTFIVANESEYKAPTEETEKSTMPAANTRLRPKASERLPTKSDPMASATRYTVSICCMSARDMPKVSEIAWKAGTIPFVANGPSEQVTPKTAT